MKRDEPYLRHIADDYFEVDLRAVWETVQRDLSGLEDAVRNYLHTRAL